jgi:hypothetical protein|tara:strand:- start:216 stop:506 length:291 start_codon:yes stop_codon:yes gene_type:complete
MSKKLDEYVNEVLENIRNDRKITRDLLDDAIKWLSKDESRHREIGMVMSKYVETLQRSNEQLVKIAGMVSKSKGSEGLSKKDMEDIYDAISSENDE